LAEKLGHQALWVYSAINHGWHQVSAGALTEGLGLLERAWQTADRINRTTEAYRATSFAGNRYFLLDDPKAAAACYARELAKPRLVAALTRRLALISSQAVLSAVTGDLVTARTLLDQVDPHTFPQDSAMLAEPMLAFWSGDWDAAEAIWSEQRDRYQRVGNRWGVADYACWLARLRQVRGDLVGASQLFTDALSIAVEGPIIPIELKTRTALAHIAVELHDAAAARAHLRRCYDLMAGGENWRGLLGRVALAEGEVLMASGDQHRAEEAFARAVEIFQQHDLVWDTAEAYLTWSRITGAKGFEKRQRALDIYQLHEAGTAWIQRALPSHSRARRDRVYPDGLSQREVQVVRLVAAGMTNREIAATLVISRNTVERHVNHILMKTGSVNRTQVAAYAHRHSLITE
jgi:DNA-binding CsgD family transcriptional regulator